MILPMMKGHSVSIKALRDMMEIGCAVRVDQDGNVTLAETVKLPEVINSDGELSSPDGTEWVVLEGYSGQYSYNGPVMHPSEYIGGKLAKDILAVPGTYVCLVVEADCDDSCSDDCGHPFPEGWIVATVEESHKDVDVACHDHWCVLIGCPNQSTVN